MNAAEQKYTVKLLPPFTTGNCFSLLFDFLVILVCSLQGLHHGWQAYCFNDDECAPLCARVMQPVSQLVLIIGGGDENHEIFHSSGLKMCHQWNKWVAGSFLFPL